LLPHLAQCGKRQDSHFYGYPPISFQTICNQPVSQAAVILLRSLTSVGRGVAGDA